MRKSINLILTVLFFLGISITSTNALPCKFGCCQKDSGNSKNEPFFAFYGLNYAMMPTQPSALNSWLVTNGYGKMAAQQSTIGISEIFFGKKWIVEYSGNFSLASANTPTFGNIAFGSGYNFWNNRLFSAYGAVSLGLNETYFQPNTATLNEIGKFNQPSGSYLEQYGFLVNPHILLYRNITPNLSMRENRVSNIGVGLEFGYNLTMFTGQWYYRDGSRKPAVAVSGIPGITENGFYAMGKIGWYWGRMLSK